MITSRLIIFIITMQIRTWRRVQRCKAWTREQIPFSRDSRAILCSGPPCPEIERIYISTYIYIWMYLYMKNLIFWAHLARPPDPAGKYATDIVAAVEEKEAGDGCEICRRPHIVRLRPAPEWFFNFTTLHLYLYWEVMRTITLGKTERVVPKSTKRLRANLENHSKSLNEGKT